MRDSERTAVQTWLATLSPLQLSRLRDALASDDPRLIQRVCTDPPPIHGLRSQRCCGTCLVGFPLLDAQPTATTEQIDDYIQSQSMALTPPVLCLVMSAWDECGGKPRPRAEAIADFLPVVDEAMRARTT